MSDDVREVPLPANWYMGAHGDPIAQFDYLALRLHPDGTVTWRGRDGQGDNGHAIAPEDPHQNGSTSEVTR